jgi:acyl-coenzyme A synthetase/AMP-(fatty) acid ligase
MSGQPTADPVLAVAPPYEIPEHCNIADYFLDARVREGKGESVALRTDAGALTFREVRALANRFGHLLIEAGVRPEERVLVALPDTPEFVGALFGALKIGAAVVMVNPHLRPDAIEYFLDYTRASVALVDPADHAAFQGPAGRARALRELIMVDDATRARLAALPAELENYPTHRDDPAVWLFSGGTSGRPKAAVQPHGSYINSTIRYGHGILGYTERDLTISVPKLFFGYALGSNLLFPFSVGAAAVLFPERCTPEVLCDKIARFRPTILVNVPTMVQQMVGYAEEVAASAGRKEVAGTGGVTGDETGAPLVAYPDLSSLRLATSAGEALPAELHERWRRTFGVELLDGLGTAEMWHIFISNCPGEVRPGTLGKVVPGFEVRICDEDGAELPPGEVGFLHVRGDSRALGYWQRLPLSKRAFRGEWYVSEDMLSRGAEGWFTYHGRADDMLKVSGKWLAPAEVENCLLRHPAVRECAVVGAPDEAGLMRTRAYLVLREEALPARGGAQGEPPADQVAAEVHRFAREHLESYKVPREFKILGELPRTHLGKVDRGRLRGEPTRADPIGGTVPAESPPGPLQ